MSKRYLKEFLFFPDILIMSTLFFICLAFMIPKLLTFGTWIAIILGILVYTIVEYATHRFVFHMKAPKNPILLKLMKRLHYDHHAKPNDLHLLFLPLWYSLPNVIVAGGIAFLVTSSLSMTIAFITGIMFMILFYEWKHYVAHRPIKPVSSWGRWMKKVHQWHHFKNENYWYGVTNPTFDYVMGTFKDQKDVELSKTARDLEKRGEHEMDVIIK